MMSETLGSVAIEVDQRQLAEQLLVQAKEQGIELVGPSGLLNQHRTDTWKADQDDRVRMVRAAQCGGDDVGHPAQSRNAAAASMTTARGRALRMRFRW